MPSPIVRHVLHPLYRRLETSVHPLRYLFVEITQRCNLRCLHCGSDCSAETRHDELSTEEWLAFLDYLPSHFDTQKLVVVVTGGEPLCCPQWGEILTALNRNGLTWGMVSNGYALTQKNLSQAIRHGMKSLTISLDGLRASHDWLRGKPGSFQRAVQAIRRVAAAKLPFFDVVTCVNPRNLGELPQVQRLLMESGAPAWRLFCIFPKGRAADNRSLILSEGELKQFFDWLGEARSALGRGGFSMQFSCEGYLPQDVENAVREEPYFCRAGISIASVLCDGAIGGCPNISRSLVQGNVRSDDLRTVWQERFQPYRKRDWMRQGACVGCRDWKRCQGNSLHLWDSESRQTMRCYLEALR